RIRKAVQEGATAPPADLRFLKRPKEKVSGDMPTGKVTSYLETLYQSVAETLPDVKDDGVECTFYEDASGDPVDNYVVAMDTTAKRGKRKTQKGLEIHSERAELETRFLPPGCMKDYFEQFLASEAVNISFTTFWTVWKVEYPHLKFRPVSTHTLCATCVHHKLMLRSLSQYILARKKQLELFTLHLKRQYEDRQAYWTLRANSRLRTFGHIVLIIDGMDQCKFCWPRSHLMRAKDLSLFQRPKLHITGLIVHGWSLCFSISNSDHPKDSSVSAELICHALTVLSRKCLLRDTYVHVVSDNTSRETKNNTVLRLLAALTLHGVIHGASLRNLRSGHSHEDIDQVFGSLALFLVKQGKDVQTPDGFVSIIKRFAETAHRPHESDRRVILLDQHRDWPFAV
ncbi:FO synthase subunit 1, partial [Durusdinium trenchii]